MWPLVCLLEFPSLCQSPQSHCSGAWDSKTVWETLPLKTRRYLSAQTTARVQTVTQFNMHCKLEFVHTSVRLTCRTHSKLGLGDISHAILMRISSVKPVLWLVVNLHHLFSDGAAFNTRSRRSLTSHAISRSYRMRFISDYERDFAWLVSKLRLRVLNAAPSERYAWESHEIYHPALF